GPGQAPGRRRARGAKRAGGVGFHSLPAWGEGPALPPSPLGGRALLFPPPRLGGGPGWGSWGRGRKNPPSSPRKRGKPDSCPLPACGEGWGGVLPPSPRAGRVGVG